MASDTPNSAQSTTSGSTMPPPVGQGTFNLSSNNIYESQTATIVNASGSSLRQPSTGFFEGGVLTGRERYTRRYKAAKDIIVTASTIILNRVHMVEYQLPNGKTKQVAVKDFSRNYSFLEEYNTWSTDKKKEFWQAKDGSWIEVQIDITSIGGTSKANPVVEMLRKLGPEAYHNAQFIFVSLIWPTAPKKVDSVAFLPLGTQVIDSDSPPIDFNAHQGLVFLSALAKEIEEIKTIKTMGVIIRTPAPDATLISLSQLLHALPFCELSFKKWGLWSQPKSFMQAIRLGRDSETLLNCEWQKICQAEWEKNRLQEALYEEYLSSVVRVTPSLDPTVHSYPLKG